MMFSISMLGNINNVFANEDNSIILVEAENVELIPDDVITDNMIEVGENYAKEMNDNPLSRMDGEVYTLTSQRTVVSHGPIKAAFGDIVPIKESRTKSCSWSISAGTSVRGYKLGLQVSGSKSITQSGPGENTKLADGKKATHRSFFAVGYGRLVQYNYKVTQKYSGAFVRNEVRYMYADVSTVSCSQLIQLSGSTVHAENLQGTKVRHAGSLANYKSQFSKIDGSCLYYYNW